MSMPALATLVLRADAVANAVLATGILALSRTLTPATGLSGGWPFAVAAVLLLANAVLCWRAARGSRPSPRALRRLADVDAVFTIAVLWLALADPTGMLAWLRAVSITLAIVVGMVALAKVLLARRLAPTRSVADAGQRESTSDANTTMLSR